MSDKLSCFRCGASLDQLSLPIGRRDECPECAIHLHVCRMCVYFDDQVPKQCREDDADEVFEKEKVNFCEWYKPSPDAFDPASAADAPAECRLLKDGEMLRASDKRTSFAQAISEPGVYRVEAYLRYKGRRRGWIFSNPIYIR